VKPEPSHSRGTDTDPVQVGNNLKNQSTKSQGSVEIPEGQNYSRLTTLNGMAFGLAVDASQRGLRTPHARLNSSRWSDSTGRAFHPLGPDERFQDVIDIPSSSPKLAWRNRIDRSMNTRDDGRSLVSLAIEDSHPWCNRSHRRRVEDLDEAGWVEVASPHPTRSVNRNHVLRMPGPGVENNGRTALEYCND
jgi:hypothetical protein